MATAADHARVLVGLAADHELAARTLLGVEGVTDAGVGFHAGQAVERSLKAVLSVRGVEYPFTHDLGVLLACCKENRSARQSSSPTSTVCRLWRTGCAARYPHPLVSIEMRP